MQLLSKRPIVCPPIDCAPGFCIILLAPQRGQTIKRQTKYCPRQWQLGYMTTTPMTMTTPPVGQFHCVDFVMAAAAASQRTHNKHQTNQPTTVGK